MRMAIEIKSDSAICHRCGLAFGRRKGNFLVSYAPMYKGVGYLPICKECTELLYKQYLAQCNDAKAAVRQVCRALNIYWNEEIFIRVSQKNTTRSLMTGYLVQSNANKYIGKCYDDTLAAEGTLWNITVDGSGQVNFGQGDTGDQSDISPEVIAFWGTGMDAQMYRELEQRKAYWLDRLPDDLEVDIGTEVIIKQICMLEIDINKARAEGKPVDKYINTLNTLLGSGNFKPAQKKKDLDSDIYLSPMGVWAERFENQEPIPEPDEEFKDTNRILKYIFTWMGHLPKMLGKKYGYTKMYEEAIQRLSVERPDLAGEEDEDFLVDALDDVDLFGDE